MKVTIHRGINQIGGCITEIATSNTRILIDLGLLHETSYLNVDCCKSLKYAQLPNRYHCNSKTLQSV